MATESPVRIVESSRARKWASSKDVTPFASAFNITAADESGFLLEGHEIYGDLRKVVPNRSGSAPPSVEGSFTTYGNLVLSSSLNSSLASSSSVLENCQSEEELLSDPSYFAYYCSNVNLNPRLPPPIVSRENRHLVCQIGGFGNNRKLTSFDDSGDGSLHWSKGSLSTHNEEPEDNYLAQQDSDDWAESANTLMIGHNAASSAGRCKSLVDSIQVDFPRTASPVYNLTQPQSHGTTEEPLNLDIEAISMNNLSMNVKKFLDSESSSLNDHVGKHSEGANACELTVNEDSLVALLPENSIPYVMGDSPPMQKVGLNCQDGGLQDDVVISGVAKSDASRNFLPVEDIKNEQDQQFYEKNVQQPCSPQSTCYQVEGSQSQLIAPRVNYMHNYGTKKFQHTFPSVEAQPVMRPLGIVPPPPLYAAASYMASGNPLYPNLNPPALLYDPQYSPSGYALSSPFIAEYHSHAAFPMHFDASYGHGFNSHTAGVSTGESISYDVNDLQHWNQFYGHHRLMVQPPFPDPFHMQYFQRHPVEDAYVAPGQYGHLASAGLKVDQVYSFNSLKESSNIAADKSDQKFQTPPNGSLSIPSRGIAYYYGSTLGAVGAMTQFSASPFGCPMVVGITHSGRRNEMRIPQGTIRNDGLYSGCQGQRGPDNFNDPKKCSFLEELKSSNSSRKFDLSDIAGRIVEFSVDQHGSRYIQQKLENCSIEHKRSVFKEVLPHASKLMTDVFGNYVIQKFFEQGNREQRKELADQLSGQMLTLSLQMYGCRVIQKALEVIEPDQKAELVHELDGHVMRCVRDQNGNHVIQKCIECIPTEKIGFIISSFQGQVANLSTHPYGCRVIQRVLEHYSDEPEIQCIVDEILESSFLLAQDQYGNYVTQHVLERGNPHERSQIISMLTGKVVQMSQHKYASNVIEKCLEHCSTAEQELLIDEILNQPEESDSLLTMMKDQFANYVVQKILEISNDKQREVLLNWIRAHLHSLKKYTYGKHIVGRFEQLSGEGTPAGKLATPGKFCCAADKALPQILKLWLLSGYFHGVPPPLVANFVAVPAN
ncbi:hypothetical protein LguiA_010140 [Lonicera macranthoides]